MDNKNLRLFLQKNRFTVDTHKLSHQRESYADQWLAIKFFEYNSVLEDIREQYKETSKTINRHQRELDDSKDEFLEEHITPQVYEILFGRK